MKNRYNLFKTVKFKPNDDYQNWDPFEIKGEAAMWRALGLFNYQSPHADDHAGLFNMIETLTNQYAIKVWMSKPFSAILGYWV